MIHSSFSVGLAVTYVLLHVPVVSRMVTLSNIGLPRDQFGELIITGEADILHHNGAYYYYANNWGSCPGVDCCDSESGCHSCCFLDPPHPYVPGCGNISNGSDPYGDYHTVQVYRTEDFTVWINLGVALPLENRPAGIVFRPHVVWNKKTKLFLMWFEDRSSSSSGSTATGYYIATSKTPDGPFILAHSNLTMPGSGRVGDFDIFVDQDETAYHVRTGFSIVRLNANYTGPDELVSEFKTPTSSEGPVMFRRNDIYYILTGSDCCACLGGATVYVSASTSVDGPWEYLGDVGSNPTPFDPHSPDNYVTKAQASTVFEVNFEGTTSYVWMGNQWNSGLSKDPPGPRNHDLLYWTVLEFSKNGTVKQVIRADNASFEIDL